jgi:hypothetical protein
LTCLFTLQASQTLVPKQNDLRQRPARADVVQNSIVKVTRIDVELGQFGVLYVQIAAKKVVVANIKDFELGQTLQGGQAPQVVAAQVQVRQVGQLPYFVGKIP